MKITKNLLAALAIATMGMALQSCSKDDPVPEVDQELITDVTLTFTEVDDAGMEIGTAMAYKASSAEGIELSTNIDIEVISGLEADKRYLLEITAYNSIAGEDITTEILEEGDEHQFYFLGSAFVADSPNMVYAYDDQDEDGFPIGLKGYVTTQPTLVGNASQFRLILRHDLDKAYAGAENPSWENFVQAGGETDLDITFPVTF
ncbi:hypothetical protein GCM10007049_04210 [Echinicola pacifica]|uniref:Fibronectin type-III domain-containing protein n=1 Tax=Echinicola pacifica TaxID=346377 RepID=A0A918PLJ3_9BACT|nr:hypothetical protein [Echinicola pacifica]GGZ15293.1 hypothetical protein GCM10007049_04210 [Echinicola pacifica]